MKTLLGMTGASENTDRGYVVMVGQSTGIECSLVMRCDT